MAEEADANLIEQAKGDRAAFGRLYDLYVHRIYGFAMAHSHTREEAEDLTAQTFERAMAAISRYESRGTPFSAWLYRIAANMAVDRARRAGRVVLLGEGELPEIREEAETTDPPRMVERWERANWLLNQVAELPHDQQQAIQLRFWGECSFAEVGEALGRSEAAARQLVYRGIRGLRGQIDGEAQSNA